MPTSRTPFNQVDDVLDHLHKAGVVNLDKTMREMLSAKEALGRLSPGGDAATAVIAWDGYGLVIKGATADLAEISNVAKQLRGAAGPTG